MSDLAATNCGGCGDCNGFGGSSCYWIIILLLLCSSCGNGLNNNGGCGCGLSSYCSSAADAATTVHLTTADVAAAANPVKNCLN